jgi:hypothetical protein
VVLELVIKKTLQMGREFTGSEEGGLHSRSVHLCNAHKTIGSAKAVACIEEHDQRSHAHTWTAYWRVRLAGSNDANPALQGLHLGKI